MRKRAVALSLACLPLLLGASECGSGGGGGGGGLVKISGTVVDRDFIAYSETKIHYRLRISQDDGSYIWVREPFANWNRCVKGTYYPTCKYPQKKV